MSETVHLAGVFEHPTREAPDKSTMQLHAEVARGALADAGLEKADVDGLLTAGVPSLPPLTLGDYIGLHPDYADSTDYGGSSYVAHVGHAASAIRDGKCEVALITLAGRPRSRGQETGTGVRSLDAIPYIVVLVAP